MCCGAIKGMDRWRCGSGVMSALLRQNFVCLTARKMRSGTPKCRLGSARSLMRASADRGVKTEAPPWSVQAD